MKYFLRVFESMLIWDSLLEMKMSSVVSLTIAMQSITDNFLVVLTDCDAPIPVGILLSTIRMSGEALRGSINPPIALGQQGVY